MSQPEFTIEALGVTCVTGGIVTALGSTAARAVGLLHGHGIEVVGFKVAGGGAALFVAGAIIEIAHTAYANKHASE